jgi:threonine dehydrogenase-like Zn-dependent dehydrogenase
MRAVVCENTELDVIERPEPVPGRGQVRIEVLRCGICGSDLHARHGMDAWADMAAKAGYDRFGRSTEPVVMGHEFCGEVAEHGPGCRKDVPAGTPVVALPLLRGPRGVDTTGLSTHAPGAYAEQMLVEESLMLAVPNGLAPDVATLTEPMAVAWHAVRRGEVGKGDVAIVIGCGPVGLGVILMLKAKGVRTVVASDLSAQRRALAGACGADVVVDPDETSPFAAVAGKGHLPDIPSTLELAVGTTEKLGRLRAGQWHVWRLAEALGAAPKRPVVFECVGPDTFTPAMAINKEIDLRFVIGYTPLEFRDTLHMLADGKVDPRPLVTGTVGLDGVENAFDALAGASDSAITHAKILVDPRSTATEPVAGS